MRQNLIYGKISWSYEEDVGSSCIPFPLVRLSPQRFCGKKIDLNFSDKISFRLLNLSFPQKLTLNEAYRKWVRSPERGWNLELGEGRSFLEWLKSQEISIRWKKEDISFHSYFDPLVSTLNWDDEFSKDHAFSIPPVSVNDRRVKLYLRDEDVLDLIHLPFGQERDFIELVRSYVEFRIQRENFSGRVHTFLEWTKFVGQRPVFRKGQLGWDVGRYFC